MREMFVFRDIGNETRALSWPRWREKKTEYDESSLGENGGHHFITTLIKPHANYSLTCMTLK